MNEEICNAHTEDLQVRLDLKNALHFDKIS